MYVIVHKKRYIYVYGHCPEALYVSRMANCKSYGSLKELETYSIGTYVIVL